MESIILTSLKAKAIWWYEISTRYQRSSNILCWYEFAFYDDGKLSLSDSPSLLDRAPRSSRDPGISRICVKQPSGLGLIIIGFDATGQRTDRQFEDDAAHEARI